MTANELHKGMIEQGLDYSFYSVQTLVFAFPEISHQQMTKMVVQLVKCGKVEYRRLENSPRIFEYKFLKGV